jgi:hypothetical protein
MPKQQQSTESSSELTYKDLVDENKDLSSNEFLSKENLLGIKKLFSEIKDKKPVLKRLLKLIGNFTSQQEEQGILQRQDLLALTLTAALAHNDNNKVMLFLTNNNCSETKKIIYKKGKLNTTSYRRDFNNYLIAQNYKRIFSLLDEKDSSLKDKNGIVEEFVKSPRSFIVDPASEYMRIKLRRSQSKKAFGYCNEFQHVLDMINKGEIPTFEQVYDAVIKQQFQSQDYIAISESGRILDHLLGEEHISLLSEFVNDNRNSHSLNFNESLKQKLAIFYELKYGFNNRDLNNVDYQFILIEYMEIIINITKDKQSRKLFNDFKRRLQAWYQPLDSCASNSEELIQKLDDLSSTPGNRRNDDKGRQEIKDRYINLRQEISRQFRRENTTDYYNDDFRWDDSDIRRSDNVTPDHTAMYLSDGRYFDASLVKLNEQDYVSCHAPYTEQTTQRYYETALEKDVKVIVSLTEMAEKSNNYNFYVDEKRRYRKFVDGKHTTMEVYYEGEDEKHTVNEDLGEIEQIKVRKIRIKQTIIAEDGTESVKEKSFHQICLKGYEDHGLVPPKVMHELSRLINLYNTDANGQQISPLMGHCHGGVGRWGTTILHQYYFNKFEQTKKQYHGFKKKVELAKKSGDWMSVVIEMAESLHNQAMKEANKVMDPITRNSLIKTAKRNFDEIVNGEANLKTADNLMEKFNPLQLTYSVHRDLFRLRLQRDAVQGPAQLSSVYNYIVHMEDEYKKELGINETLNANHDLFMGERYTPRENARRLSVLWQNRRIDVPQIDRSQPPAKQQDQTDGHITKNANKIHNTVLSSSTSEAYKEIRDFEDLLYSDLDDIEVNVKSKETIAYFRKNFDTKFVQLLCEASREMRLARMYKAAAINSNVAQYKDQNKVKSEQHVDKFNSIIKKLPVPGYEFYNKLITRVCKLDRSVHYFLKAMMEAKVSYLELDEAIAKEKNQSYLKPGVALGRYLFQTNWEDLLVVVKKVKPGLFNSLGEFIAKASHEKLTIPPSLFDECKNKAVASIPAGTEKQHRLQAVETLFTKSKEIADLRDSTEKEAVNTPGGKSTNPKTCPSLNKPQDANLRFFHHKHTTAATSNDLSHLQRENFR